MGGGGVKDVALPLANEIYGKLKEGVHVAGYSFGRACENLEKLLQDDAWRTVGSGFDDVNKFLETIRLDEKEALGVAVETKKRIAKRIKELQPEASQRAIASAVGTSEQSVARSLGKKRGNAPKGAGASRKTSKSNGPKDDPPPKGASDLSGEEAAKAAAKAGERKAAREERNAEKEEQRQQIAERAASAGAASDQFDLINDECLAALSRPADSVDWVISDPPYPKEFLHVYDDLGRVAAHVLKPGGSLVCMIGHSYLPDIVATLCQTYPVNDAARDWWVRGQIYSEADFVRILYEMRGRCASNHLRERLNNIAGGQLALQLPWVTV